MQSQIRLRRALTPAECAELVRSAFEQGYFMHLAGLKDSADEFLQVLST
jgi:hypothetical protein